jgi:glycosyltransferase involved in cell wall biosynthesis
MDRWDDLLRSMGSLTGQNFSSYSLVVVALGSVGLPPSVWDHPHVVVLQFPRPRYFSFAWARNAGARFSQSDWLLFMNADNEWTGPDGLGAALSAVCSGDGAQADWYRQWRRGCGFAALPIPRSAGSPGIPKLSCYGHAHGSVLLVERRAFLAVGGYNERIRDWGFEDTDLIARLEGIGCSRVPISKVRQRGHGDDSRLANFRHKNRKYTWHRNRLFSDISIRLWGPVGHATTHPGAVHPHPCTCTRPDATDDRSWCMEPRRPGPLMIEAAWTVSSLRARLSLPWLVDVGSESYTDQES